MVIDYSALKNRIRLTEIEFFHITNEAQLFFKGKPYLVSLFGSRAEYHKTGGDIDLLVEVGDNDYEWTVGEKIFLSSRIKMKIGDQKIDITVTTASRRKSDAFIQCIENEILLGGIQI